MSGRRVCVSDFEEEARKVLPKAVYDYYRSGADEQYTLADNVAAFNRWHLVPRVLRDVSTVDLSVSVLGHRLSMPLCVAATAMQRMAHPEGETATARASLAFSEGNYGNDSGLAVYVAKAIDPSLCWDDITWLKKHTRLPVIVKGILNGDDAVQAVNYGVSGVLVSNHGARQLDGVPSTVCVLLVLHTVLLNCKTV
ncbi:hypothetical protein F2P81_014482 [Scophthalmus maximus]|uniref:FMN hydroxy acid dehydrogenase domain-containing protein n=1 Tax=Scophthalmus maximus TaxID=52904 RepID=A0A6A4SPC6_SCOMX|nr:hypothetical protein F2P81_014482 [Scophthalmus maximus]